MSDILQLHYDTCPRHVSGTAPSVKISIDGVNETKSTSRSLEIISIQFSNCQQVYPCLISRPEVFQKKRMKPSFEVYVSSLLDELEQLEIQVEKVILDAPERAAARKQKQHGGYYSCDWCLATPENFAIEGKRASNVITVYLNVA